MTVCGKNDANIKLIERALGLAIYTKGTALTIKGASATVTHARDIINELVVLTQKNVALDETKVERIIHTKLENAGPLAPLLSKKLPLAKGRSLAPKTPSQATYMEKIETHDVTFAVGPAGTGKSYLAVALGLYYLLNDRYERLVLTRPVVEAGESLGFLPGDFEEKVSPYMRPLYDALYHLAPFDTVKKYADMDRIEVAPLAYMRGRTLANAYIILDEAQNTTIPQMKMFLSRMGEGAKMVITGDITQSDLPRSTSSGLQHALRILKHVHGIAVHEFDRADVVRHRLVQHILAAYDEAGN
ncbi:MAG: PhoH family protein [Spirochaetes bacterium]|nr:PhoH family protein [Spirochaetota bacterium]